MPIVRELITILGFQVEEAKIQRAERLVQRYSQASQRAAVVNDRANFAVGRFTAGLVGLTTAAFAARGVIGELQEYERLLAMLESLTGSTEQARREYELIESVATRTPFTIDEVTRGYVRLLGVGLEPTARTMMALSNVSASMGASIERLVDGITGVPAGLTRQLENVLGGIVAINRSTNQLEITFRGTTHVINRDLQSIMELMVRLGETEVGDASERFMARLPGRMSNAVDAVKKFVREFGEGGFTEALNEFLLAFTEGTQAGEGTARMLGKVMGDALRLFARFLEFATKHADLFKTALEGLFFAVTGGVAMRFLGFLGRFIGVLRPGATTTLRLEQAVAGGAAVAGGGGGTTIVGGMSRSALARGAALLVRGLGFAAGALGVQDIVGSFMGQEGIFTPWIEAFREMEDSPTIFGNLALALGATADEAKRVEGAIMRARNSVLEFYGIQPSQQTRDRIEEWQAAGDPAAMLTLATARLNRRDALLRRTSQFGFGQGVTPELLDRASAFRDFRRQQRGFEMIERAQIFGGPLGPFLRAAVARGNDPQGFAALSPFPQPPAPINIPQPRNQPGIAIAQLNINYNGDPEAQQTRREMAQGLVDEALVPALESLAARFGGQ